MEREPRPTEEEAPAAQEDLSGRERRYKPINRNQMVMHPVDLAHLLPEDDPARIIWELVGELDLGRYHERIRAVEERAGRPATDPRLLASLWLLAYSQGIASAREIDRRCRWDPQYMWLTGCEPISFVTLCEFRRMDGPAQREMYAEMLGVLAAQGLVRLERTVQDGTRIQAYASADTFRGEETIEAKIGQARQRIKELEKQEEAGDWERASVQKAAALRRQLETRELAREELKKLQAVKAKKKIAASQAKVSISDPQARMMKKPHGGYEPSYNAQIVADAQSGVVVAAFVSQSGSDAESLKEGIEQTEQNTGRKPEQTVVDGGYASHSNIVEAKQIGVELYSSPADRAALSAAACRRWSISEEFRPEAFRYQTAENCYVCPAGKILNYHSRSEDPQTGAVQYRYQARAADCQACPWKSQCCPKTKDGRTVSRTDEAPAVRELKARMETESGQRIYAERKRVIELVNACLKSKLGLRQFHLQGLIKVGMELLWACMAYNVRVWLRVCGAVAPAPPGQARQPVRGAALGT
jgi:transposase